MAALVAAGATIENRGVVPHVRVEATPHDAQRSCDAQLEAAVAKAAALVAERQRQLAAAEEEERERERATAPPAARSHWSMPLQHPPEATLQ